MTQYLSMFLWLAITGALVLFATRLVSKTGAKAGV
jgi:hypothetical protein